MGDRFIDIVEDIGLGITREQLAPKPSEEDNKDGNKGTNSEQDWK